MLTLTLQLCRSLEKSTAHFHSENQQPVSPCLEQNWAGTFKEAVPESCRSGLSGGFREDPTCTPACMLTRFRAHPVWKLFPERRQPGRHGPLSRHGLGGGAATSPVLHRFTFWQARQGVSEPLEVEGWWVVGTAPEPWGQSNCWVQERGMPLALASPYRWGCWQRAPLPSLHSHCCACVSLLLHFSGGLVPEDWEVTHVCIFILCQIFSLIFSVS